MRKLKKLKNIFESYKIDGYLVPKNDEFLGEYVPKLKDNLKYISNFSGSYGFALILKKSNYLFVDGRYTLQAKIQSGKNFKVLTMPNKFPSNIIKHKKLCIGFDPKLHTESMIKHLFKNSKCELKPLKENLIDKVWIRKNNEVLNKFYKLNDKNSGQSSKIKLNKISKILNINKIDLQFISASENVAWLLNLRGSDSEFTPIPNSYLLLNKKNEVYFFCDLKKINQKLKKNLKDIKILNIKYIEKFLLKIKNKTFQIDTASCSVYFKSIIKKNNIIVEKQDPTYLLKSIKNKVEIKNTIQTHIYDGAAVTKFLFWVVNNFRNKKITEMSAQKKLLKFRKKIKSFRSLSFPTISGSGPNGAIIHYKATKKSNRILKKGDLYLVDSGGQYNFGTTDVTRTISLGNNQPSRIKNIFTRVLKGHIAVASYNLNKNTSGSEIDIAARKPLKEINLNYAHGTGHGVGYFLNVHEGPHAISRGNSVKLKEGMIVSNEPGYYESGKFGIRIENLITVKKSNENFEFENLTLAPIDKSLIEKKLLNRKEVNWLNAYHFKVFNSLKKFMNKSELLELKNSCSNI